MMRGDLKWPPENTRKQMFEEVEEQKKIAEGPKFRPKKPNKVIKSFFLSFVMSF
jgi:hypothetical protein